MLMYAYLGILLVMIVLIIRNMFKTDNLIEHFESMLVLIPFVMRLLLIK